jgi:hypothetical protein
MDEEFDKKLTDHIRGVFENYEHPADADAGWTALRKKFPVEKGNNKAAWLWWSSAAAILLIALGVGLWVRNMDTPVKNYAHNRAVKPQQKDSLILNDVPETLSDTAVGPDNTTVGEDNIAKTNKQPANDPLASNLYHNNFAARYPVATGTINPIQKTSTDPTPVTTKPEPVNSNIIAGTVTPNTTADSGKAITAKVNEQQIVIANTTSVTEKAVKQNNAAVDKATNVTAAAKQPKNIIDLLRADEVNNPVKKQNKTVQDKKVNFSVYAATYFNYAEGSANQVNAGAGFTSDIKLSRKIKLSTGIALAQNTLRYNSSLPPSDGGQAMAFAASAAPGIQGELFSAVSSVPVFKNYNANLIGLDVPINIKYEFNPEKSDTYVSAGLSSGTFIDEKYTYSYTYSNNRTATPQNSVTTNSFNSFYFGKTLNVSFGVGYPLGKSNRLIIEPFLKYPLDGLGAQQLRFGAGGLNLKINFKTTKK